MFVGEAAGAGGRLSSQVSQWLTWVGDPDLNRDRDWGRHGVGHGHGGWDRDGGWDGDGGWGGGWGGGRGCRRQAGRAAQRRQV